jgi:hypothetical protein
MKSLILFVLLLTALSSCSSHTKENYSVEEIKTLVAMKQATYLKDSISVGLIKYPIVAINKNGYYPSMSKGAGLRYYMVTNPK